MTKKMQQKMLRVRGKGFSAVRRRVVPDTPVARAHILQRRLHALKEQGFSTIEAIEHASMMPISKRHFFERKGKESIPKYLLAHATVISKMENKFSRLMKKNQKAFSGSNPMLLAIEFTRAYDHFIRFYGAKNTLLAENLTIDYLAGADIQSPPRLPPRSRETKQVFSAIHQLIGSRFDEAQNVKAARMLLRNLGRKVQPFKVVRNRAFKQ